ncbi:MAG: beta-N-acetylhexosaminidase [Gammaproteobacteria bacterium]|nr:beta-N-acetylhexosaminidase [Gammaproteobacteria bacterium]
MGQLIVGISGVKLTPEEKQVLVHPLIAGVILFSRNYQDKLQLADLNASILALRKNAPLSVYVDQEGGRVQRFREGFTALPALGDLTSTQEAQRYASIMASELKAVGVDYSFAPIVDLDRGSRVIGKRAFSASPEHVIAYATAYIQGMDAMGMSPILKHFPGHGTAIHDTHVAIATDQRAFEEILATDLMPFQHFIAAGVFGIMISHVIYPAVDALPASISRFWIQSILRERFRFQGKIFSDDLGMKAIQVWGSPLALVQRVFAAGTDYALLCNEWSHVLDVIRGV